jgi:hypothetical protein
MSEPFEVGEIVITKNMPDRPAIGKGASLPNGIEVTIHTLHGVHWVMVDGRKELLVGYIVVAQNGDKHGVGPHQLRKKKPPAEDRTVVSWDDVPWWQPAKERV